MFFCMNPLFQPVLPLAAHQTFSTFFKLLNNNIYASDSQSCTSIQFLRNICRWLWELYCFGMSQLSHGCFFAILIFESDSNHWLPPSPSTNSKAGPCRESWEIIEGNPLNLEIAEKLIRWKEFVLLCGPRWKRRSNVSDEGFWGSIGGWLERFWGRWRRYGAAEGQGGVEPEKDKYKDKDKDKDKDKYI